MEKPQLPSPPASRQQSFSNRSLHEITHELGNQLNPISETAETVGECGTAAIIRMDDDERQLTPISEAGNAEEAPGAILPVRNGGQHGSTLAFPPGPPLPYDFTVEIAGLDEVPEALAERIHRWIGEVLGSVQQDGSYGTILKCRRGQVGQVCVVFGFPDPEKFNKHGEVPGGMPLLVRKDWIVNSSNPAWSDRVTSTKLEKIHLQDVSLGLKGDMSKAGSFGGWFRGTKMGPVCAVSHHDFLR